MEGMRPPRDMLIPSIHHHEKRAKQGCEPIHGFRGFSVATKILVSIAIASVGGQAPSTSSVLKLAGSTSYSKVSSAAGHTSCMKIIQ